MASDSWMARLAELFGPEEPIVTPRHPFARAEVMPGVLPEGEGLAMDSALEAQGFLDQAMAAYGPTKKLAALNSFIGYPALSLLQQNGIVQAMVATLTDEMMRKWLTLEGDGFEKVEMALNALKVREHFRWAAEMSGFQGGCMLYIAMGVEDDPEELAQPLSLDPGKVPQGSFQGFRQIEPYSITPAPYESANPLKADYFRPLHWYVNGKRIHRSRFLHFAWNTPPVLLRPAYNFFGIPLTQVALPYITNFERSRDAASQLVYNFSLLGLKTKMAEIMQPGGTDGKLVSGVKALKDRCKAFLGLRNNNGLAVIDKEDEEFFQINTPLGGVEGLVAQQLELISLISRIPVTKLFGTPPRGFNATGESDERFFNDQINAIMSRLFIENFKRAKALVELSELGAVQPQVTEAWQELLDPDPLQAAQIELAEAQTDAIYLQNNVALQTEVRKRLNNDPASPYHGKLPEGVKLPEVNMASPELAAGNLSAVTAPQPDMKKLALLLTETMGGGNG
jgi:phage-related protein (TIGR01555 family)